MVPECEGYAPLFANEPAQALLPPTTCARYEPLHNTSLDSSSCDRDHFLNSTLDCDQFVYEHKDTTFAEVLPNNLYIIESYV